MDHNLYHEIEDKAQILVDSLPYIRDFNQKIIIFIICVNSDSPLLFYCMRCIYQNIHKDLI